MEHTSVGLAGSVLPEANLYLLGTRAGPVKDIRTKELPPENE